MKSNNIYKIGFLIMLVINVVILTFLLVKPNPKKPGLKPDRLMFEISQKLNLNKEQEAEYFKLAQAHAIKMRSISDQQMELIKNYFNLLKSENDHSNTKISIEQKINFLDAEKLRLTFNHFEELKSLCSPESISEYNEMVEKIIPKIIGRDKSNPPPPGR